MAMIHVGVRCRPLIKREKDQSESIKWRIDGKTIYQAEGTLKHGGAYTFDHVFEARTTNEELYDEIAAPIISSAMEGFHGTIFAYGQTASGKTFTMMGSEESPGVIPRTVKQIFDCIENTPNREFLVRVSYMEIYNETVSDLLGDCSKSLDVREEQGQVFVKNLTEEMVNQPQVLLDVMKKGESNRHVASTNMNERSSRSHTIFRIIIESKDVGDGIDDYAVNVSHLNLVDLAGSEKAKQTGATGQRLVEGSSINKSLLTLGQVISQLSESAGFINYRDSKLTRILQNSLGGNSKTAIICNVTPASVDETHSTLRFASSAKKIKNRPKVNEVLSNEAMLKRYRNTIADLEKELNTYKTQESMARSKLKDEREEQLKKLRDLFVRSTKQREVKTRMKRRETWCPGKALASFVPPGLHAGGLDLACGGLTDALPFDGPRRFRKPSKKEIISKFELLEEEDLDAEVENEKEDFRQSLPNNSISSWCQTEPDVEKLKLEIEELQEQAENERIKKEKLERDIEEIQKQAENEKMQKEQLENDVVDLAEQAENEKVQREKLENDIKELQEQVENEKKQREKLESDNETLLDNYRKVLAELEQKDADYSKVLTELEQKDADFSKVFAELEQKDADFKELEAYTRWEGDFKNQSLMGKVAPEEQNAELLAEIEMLTSKVMKLEDEKQQLKKWYEEAAKDGLQAQEELMDSKDVIANLEKELEEKTNQIGQRLDNKNDHSRIQDEDLASLEKEMQAAKLEEAMEEIANLQKQTQDLVSDFAQKEESYAISLSELRAKNELLIKEKQAKEETSSEGVEKLQGRVDELMEELQQRGTKHTLEVEKLKMEIEELQERAECSMNEDENERIEKIIMEKEEYESRVSELEEQLRELQQGNENTQHDELSKIKSEKEKAKQEIEKLNTALCELTSEKSSMEEHVKELCLTIEEMKGESVSNKSSQESDEVIQKLNLELKELKSDKSVMEEHVKELCQFIEELKGEKESEVKKCKVLEDELTSLKTERHRLQIESGTSGVNSPMMMKKGGDEYLKQQLQKEREEHNELRSKYEQLMIEAETNKGRLLSETNKELDQQRRLEEMEKARRESIALFSQRSQEQTAEIDGLHKQIHDLKSQLQKASGERELAVHQQQKLQEDIEKLKGELRTLEDLQKVHEAESRRNDKDPEKMMDRIKKMGVSLDLTSQRCQNYEMKIKELEAKAKKTENAIFEKNNLELQVRDLNQSLEKLQESYSKIQNSSSNMHTKLADIQLQLDMEQHQVSKMTAEKDLLNEKLSSLEHEKEEFEKEKNKATEELKKISFDNQNLHKESSKLKEEVEELQQQLNCGISEEAIEDLIKTHDEKLKTSVADAILQTETEAKQRFEIQLEKRLKEERENAETELESQILAIQDQVMAKQLEEKTELLTEHSQEINLLQSEHHATLEEMKNDHEKTLQTLQEEHTNEVVSLTERIDELEIKYKACFEELEETADKLEKAFSEKDELEKHYLEDIKLLKEEIDDILKSQPEKPHQELLDEQKSRHQNEIKCLQEEHEKSTTKLMKEIEELQIQFNDCSEKLRETDENLEKVTQEKGSLEEKHEVVIKQLKEEMANIQKNVAEKPDQSHIDELKCLHETEVKALIEAHAEEIQSLQTKHSEEVNALIKKHEDGLETTQNTYQEELDLMKQCVEEGEQSHQDEIDQLKKKHTISFEEASSSHLTEILELQNAHAIEIDTMKEQHKEEMETLLQEQGNVEAQRESLVQAQREIQTLKEEIEELHGCLSEAQAEKEAVEQEHENYVKQSRRFSITGDSGLQVQRETYEEKTDLQEKIETLESKLEDAKNLTQERDSEIEKLHHTILEAKSKYSDKKKEIQRLTREVGILKEKLSLLTEDTGNANPERNEKVFKLMEEIKELKEDKKKLYHELALSEQYVDDLEHEKAEHIMEKSKLEAELAKHSAKTGGQEVAKLVERIKELEAQDNDVAWYKKCCDEADAELEEVKAKLATKEKQYNDQIEKLKAGGTDSSLEILSKENKDLKKMVADCKMNIVGLEAALLTAKDPLKKKIVVLEEDIKQKDENIFYLKNEVRKQKNLMSAEDSICVKPTKSALPAGHSVHDGQSGIVLNEKVYCLEAENFKLSRQLKQLTEENKMLKKNAFVEKDKKKQKVDTPTRAPLRETDVTKRDMATQWESQRSQGPLMPRLVREPGYEEFYLDNASSPGVSSPRDGCAQQ